MTTTDNNLYMLYADEKDKVYDDPGHYALFRTGNRIVTLEADELIELPFGSYLFSLPGRLPMGLDAGTGKLNSPTADSEGRLIRGASAFLASGYLRTFLPAYKESEGAPKLPLWAYAGAAYRDGKVLVPAMRIDDDPRSDPKIHQDREALVTAIGGVEKQYPENRLVKQLHTCSLDYDCLCARNFFLSRHEAPLPTSPACNARCAGCLSHQGDDAGFSASQFRLTFEPTVEEIAQVTLHHFEAVDEAVASFGQGCEGEPLLRGNDLARSIGAVREKTDRGTININTNGSLPETVKAMIDAGLDSIRVSMNSPTEEAYNRYYQPKNYSFADVLKTLEVALDAGIWVSVNLFFMPGFTDSEEEVEALIGFLERFPVNMIQARNLNIDPDLYFETIGFTGSEPVGIRDMVDYFKEEFSSVRWGYYNPAKESF